VRYFATPRRLLTACVLTPLIAGCTVGPNFVSPQANAPKGWTDTALPKVANGARPSPFNTKPDDDVSWWASFHDATLSTLIVRAATSNLDVREAVLRISEARAQRSIAAADQWPTLGGNASYTRQGFSDTTAQGSLFNSIGSLGHGTGITLPSYPNPYDQYQIGFDASWEPDLFGGVRRSVEAASADTQASIEDSHDALVSLEGEVARAYTDLRGAQLKLAVTRANLATQREVLTLARQRKRAGLTTDIDVSNADAQVTSSRSQVPLLERQIEVDINQLSQLLAREPGGLRAELIAAQPIPAAPANIAIGLPADLARRRPDIRASEARLHAATAQIGVATANLYPSISLDASFGTQAEHPLDLTRWASRFFSLGPTLNVPIFEGGKLKAMVQLADVRQKEAAVDYAKTVLSALHDVENALIAYNTEGARRLDLEATAARNRNTLALARQRYTSGLTTFLDVLDAERSLQQTELALADSDAAKTTDLIALYKALGGGWQTAAVPALVHASG
jgi:outer membrane protein, multidrug efflux system